ncbi:alkaline shock response membrane anchor protein AmaP [Desulfosporosinus sp.]|uniref:alkaline shock response membrane anchor protein AmaP n=1 Tax=Desulfosporosinus sp. TaxID=157907 RepID=UPI00231E5DD3|nr:alkaline shock response membrane anchor protein AmaP [Desulfosporosinus sp.]MCO5387985.1 alkaline shock response membrane anchor protein AmaP [Desulfosporosinus sp.]MDA8223204.1 alkaline shock response membrane anchor protein AmaP [Desulfitobacterium hafniense]
MLAYALGLLLILGALWILAIATGWGLPYFLIAQGLNWLRWNPWESIIAAGVLLVLGLLLFMRPRARTDYSFRTSLKGGDVRISHDALQEIVARSAMALPGVLQVKSNLRQRDAGLEILVLCQFEQGVLIPQISGEILTKVKEDVELYTGIIVAEVKVLVRRLEKVQSVRVR